MWAMGYGIGNMGVGYERRPQWATLPGGPSGLPCEGGAGGREGREAFAASCVRARGEAAQRARWVGVGVPGAAILQPREAEEEILV